MSIDWVGTATCRECGKTGKLELDSTTYELHDDGTCAVLYFEMPDGWQGWDYCSRRCALAARAAELDWERELLVRELENVTMGTDKETDGEPS